MNNNEILRFNNLKQNIKNLIIDNNWYTDFRISANYHIAIIGAIEGLLDYILIQNNNLTKDNFEGLIRSNNNQITALSKLFYHNLFEVNQNENILNIPSEEIREYIISRNGNINNEGLTFLVFLINKFIITIIHASFNIKDASRQKTIDARCVMISLSIVCNFEPNELGQLVVRSLSERVTNFYIRQRNNLN